jgi:hypothetical protein
MLDVMSHHFFQLGIFLSEVVIGFAQMDLYTLQLLLLLLSMGLVEIQ